MAIINSVAEPKTGFQIAFNMFDTDGNERVDKTEFLVVRSSRDARTRVFAAAVSASACRTVAINKN